MSKPYMILTGQKFNSWTVLNNTYRKNNHRYWTCQCECGNKITVTTKYLKDHHSNPSCQDDYCPYNSYHGKSIKPGEIYGRLTVIKKAEVKNNQQLWLCKCQCGNCVKRLAYKIKEGSYGCHKSQGETIISNILSNNNIFFVEQKTFNSCRFPDTNALARFDFWVNDNYIIEFDGKQHFEYGNIFWNTKDSFEKILEHDNFKNAWCKHNNIPLIRIPYTHISKINIHDLLLDSSQFLIQEDLKA